MLRRGKNISGGWSSLALPFPLSRRLLLRRSSAGSMLLPSSSLVLLCLTSVGVWEELLASSVDSSLMVVVFSGLAWDSVSRFVPMRSSEVALDAVR